MAATIELYLVRHAIAAERDGMIAGPDRKASRHQRRTGRRALRFDHIVRQLRALFREGVHALGVAITMVALPELRESITRFSGLEARVAALEDHTHIPPAPAPAPAK